MRLARRLAFTAACLLGLWLSPVSAQEDGPVPSRCIAIAENLPDVT